MSDLKVFTDNIEPEALNQIYTLVKQPAFKDCKVRIMPDVHAGAGCVIGFTADLGDKVIPNIVGVDIGCGMLTIELGKIDIDFQFLDNIIRNKIPSGRNTHDSRMVRFDDLQKLYCYRELKDSKHLERSIGTLGGGNHFIEIDLDNEGTKYLVIHTGSRNLGKQVAEYYQKLAHRTFNPNPLGIPKELCYLTGKYRDQYLHDMEICQKYAVLNRNTIASIILDAMNWKSLGGFETIHNYIEIESNMVRKGAISAKDGELLLIPINMRDGSIIGKGKGNSDWNCSAPHGAGRIMSRSKAKETLSIEEFKETMKDIFTTSVNQSTIDESPMAYKPMDEIVNNIKGTVDIIKVIKPIYNFKASE